MRKVLTFSLFLLVGLAVSQILPQVIGEAADTVKTASDMLLYICLAFIMINVGREFEIDKTKWRSYALDYFIAMITAAMPWILICIYYVLALLPHEYWSDWEAWKETLLMSRFAAPTSAGILFTMLAALKLKSSWMYKKIQVLAIFDTVLDHFIATFLVYGDAVYTLLAKSVHGISKPSDALHDGLGDNRLHNIELKLSGLCRK